MFNKRFSPTQLNPAAAIDPRLTLHHPGDLDVHGDDELQVAVVVSHNDREL